MRVLNTHFDHVGKEARLQSAKLIADWAQEPRYAGMPTIVLGDFNATPPSPPYAALVDEGLSDARRLSERPPYGPPGTFTHFDVMRAPPEPIDHIFVAGPVNVTSHATITQHWGGRLPSDHYPVMAELELIR